MRDAQHFEIALQQTRLSRSTVLHNVREVKLDLLSQHHHGKIRFVHYGLGTLGESLAHTVGLAHRHQLPLSETGEDFVHIVFELVNTGGRELATAARHFPFR